MRDWMGEKGGRKGRGRSEETYESKIEILICS
jgi:hypothetical protein